MAAVKLTITGMTCDHCRRTVEDALREVKGVWGASVDLEGAAADVDYDSKATSTDHLVKAVRAAGYGAQPQG